VSAMSVGHEASEDGASLPVREVGGVWLVGIKEPVVAQYI